MWSYIEGEISYDEMVYRGVCATRQLAKRQQMTLVARGWEEVLKRRWGIPIGRENITVLSQTECVRI